jgi:POT family proton-dependent oligopeptide transporter
VLNGVPNDIIGKLNPITIIILIPIMDHLLYPALRKAGINFSPIKKITFGFFLASAAMIAACVTQYFIYKLGPCGDKMNNCKLGSAPITVWVQIVPYALIGMSEVMASITKLEYAFTKAPKNMRSTVQALALLTSAISSALGQALTALSEDPLLVWNYGVVAVLAAIGGVGFYYTFRQADKDEDRLNLLPNSTFIGREVHDEEAPVAVVPGPVDVKTDPFVVDEKKVVA